MDLREVQEKISEYEARHGWTNTPDERMTFLAEEIGEMAKWVRQARVEDLSGEEMDEFKKEFADVLQHICSLANHYKIDLVEALKLKNKV